MNAIRVSNSFRIHIRPIILLGLTCRVQTVWKGKDYRQPTLAGKRLTLKATITTAADDKFCNIFPNLRQKYGMILHENRLPADDSHEISCLI